MSAFRDVDGEYIEIVNSRAWCSVDDAVNGWISSFEGLTKPIDVDFLQKRKGLLVDEVLKVLRLDKFTVEP